MTDGVMRVIAGAQKGRLLKGPSSRGLRPTPNRVREALFSIIGPRIQGARVADFFAGTGAVGIEALSRGAGHVAFVDSDPQAVKLLRANVTHCGLAARAAVYAVPVATFLRRHGPSAGPYDIVFADPPYRSDAGVAFLSSLTTGVTLALGSLIILEHDSKATVPAEIGGLHLVRDYRYGDTTLSLFTFGAERLSAQ